MTTNAEWAKRDAKLQKQIDTGTTVKPTPATPKADPNAGWLDRFSLNPTGANPSNPSSRQVQGSINAAIASRQWIKPLQDLGRMVDKYPIAPTVEAYQKQAAQEKLDWARWDLNKEKAGSQANRAAMGFGPAGGNTSVNAQEAWIREHTLWNEGKPVVAVMETLPDGTVQQRLLGHPDNVRTLFTRVVPQAEQRKIAALEAYAPPPSVFPGVWEQTYQTWLQKGGWTDAPVYRLKFMDLVNKTSQTGG